MEDLNDLISVAADREVELFRNSGKLEEYDALCNSCNSSSLLIVYVYSCH